MFMLSLTAIHKPSICAFYIRKGPIRRLETNVRLGQFIFFFNERFIAPININAYMIVTKLFLNYNQFTTVSEQLQKDCD
jgi:hypothetical protein